MSKGERLPFRPKLTVPGGSDDFYDLTAKLRGNLNTFVQCPAGHILVLSDERIDWPVSHTRIYYLGSVPAYKDEGCGVTYIDPRLLKGASRIIRADQEASGEIPRFKRPNDIRSLTHTLR